MAAMADITAYDGESTPVAHVFVADHVEYSGSDLSAHWQEKTVGVPEYAQGTLLLSRKKVSSGITRVALRVTLPVMESVNGANLSGYTAAPKVAYVDTSEHVQWIHPRSLAQGRQNSRTILRNINTNNTSSSPATSGGMAYDAFVRLVFPS